MLHTPTPSHFDIPVIYHPQRFHRVKFLMISPFYIATIFVKYCYTNGSWLFYLLTNIRFSGCSPLGGNLIVKQDYLRNLNYKQLFEMSGRHRQTKWYSNIGLCFLVLLLMFCLYQVHFETSKLLPPQGNDNEQGFFHVGPLTCYGFNDDK